MKANPMGLASLQLLIFLIYVTLIMGDEGVVDSFFKNRDHANNWAVLVCTSRFWFNYRHIANVLSIYRNVKRLGIPDSNIIMMLADDVACNPRNVLPATVFNRAGRQIDLYGDNIEVDYRGYEVTVENFIRLLTGRVDPSLPRGKRLLTDDQSNILVYMTGHGGENFLKFQDAEEISNRDIADAFEQMHIKRRYNEILFMIDTCQANSMYTEFYSPNILATGSSEVGENSYSHHADAEIGVSVIDRYTNHNLEILEKLTMSSKYTLQELFDSYNPDIILSHAGVRKDLFPKDLSQVLVTDFFGGLQKVVLTEAKYNFTWTSSESEMNIPETKSMDTMSFNMATTSKEGVVQYEGLKLLSPKQSLSDPRVTYSMLVVLFILVIMSKYMSS